MKKLALATMMVMMINSATATEPILAPSLGQLKPTIGKTRTVIKSESGHHVKIPPKIKLLRSNPHSLTAIRFQNVDPRDAPDDEYLCFGTGRRIKVAPLAVWDDGEPISSYAETRLLLARHLAMKRYREVRRRTD